MKYPAYLLLSACVFGGLFIVFFLTLMSRKADHRNRGFTRTLRHNVISGPKSIELQFNSYYIAGVDSQGIYLGNSTSPARVTVRDFSLNETKDMNVRVRDQDTIAWQALTNEVRFPKVFMMERVTPALLFSDLASGEQKYYKLHATGVSAITPLSPSTWVEVCYDPKAGKKVLVKEHAGSGLRSFPNVLEKQIDGSFCTDGMLLYSPETATLCYIYFYRNQYIVLDTQINVLYKARTIDTISIAQIKVSKLATAGMTTMSAPPVVVNAYCAIDGDHLYIRSPSISGNENPDEATRMSVIDRYNLTTGSYEFSFYVPPFKRMPLKTFRVFNNSLIAVFDHYLVSYPLHL